MQHRARKRFGQNFLQDAAIIARIIRAIHPTPEEHLLEIGPGMGALTEHLLAGCPQLKAIELDRDLVPGLRAQFFRYSDFQIFEADALKFDYQTLPGPLRIVGNLPYNISTPLIFHLLAQGSHIQDMTFMLQKEVVERLAAAPDSAAYGRLSVMTQYAARVSALFEVPPTAFHPPPKVWSAIVRLEPFSEKPLQAADEQHLAETVRRAFSQRRKTLRNTLRGWLTGEEIAALGLNPSARPETLSVADFVALSDAYSRLQAQQESKRA